MVLCHEDESDGITDGSGHFGGRESEGTVSTNHDLVVGLGESGGDERGKSDENGGETHDYWDRWAKRKNVREQVVIMNERSLSREG